MKLEMISRYPANDAYPTPLLFIAGALHGAWCWDVHFLNYFAECGFAAHAVDLRGHGASEGREKLRWARIADFVEDVENTARLLPIPPILIGHSMGGFIIQKYLEEHTSPGAVLLSSPPPSGFLPAAIRVARRRPWLFARVNFTLNLSALVETPALAREAFFSADFPDDLLTEYWEQMQEESYRAFLDMSALDLPNPAKVKTPVLVLGAERDNMLMPDEIRATARAYHTQAQIIPGVAHNSMLELGWEAAAKAILPWLKEQGFEQFSRLTAAYK
jgi:pimeloyl-ACP methyl ester carboxylesterase